MDKCLTVCDVLKGSDAHLAGFLPGDIILRIEDHTISDLIDFSIHSADCEFDVKILRNRNIKTIHVRRRPLCDLGMSFQTPVPDGVKRCNSGCIFCFVDQLPYGLRSELYLKDDDYRLSFLTGNFITLNNLSRQDMKRIVDQYISPLYISLHTTDPEIRSYMMGSSAAIDGLKLFWELDKNRIKTHLQVVLCPDVNDHDVLEKTLSDLYEEAENVLSIGLVPVATSGSGNSFTVQDVLTDEGHGKSKLRSFDKKRSLEVLETVKKWQRTFHDRFKSRVVYASDELFLIAGSEIPGAMYYGGFPQIENGIGMIRDFLDEFKRELSRLSKRPQAVQYKGNFESRKFVLLTGEYFHETLSVCCAKLNKHLGQRTKAIAVSNICFGPNVKVTGLLCAEDIQKAVKVVSDDEIILIPEIIFNDAGYTLDGMSKDDLLKTITCKVHIISIEATKMIRFVLNGCALPS